jgi:three-Cys-motif partner protein
MTASSYLQPASDGLLLRDSGPWVSRKLDYLRRYIDVFETAMRGKWPTRTYIDLFAGPGKCIDRESGRVYLGSPLIAMTATHPFTHYIFVDKDQSALDALKTRASASPNSDNTRYLRGDANSAVSDVVDDLRTRPSLNLAFLDPDGIELAWTTVAALATIQRIDLIIHYPQMGLTRSMPVASTQPIGNQVDQFFGGPDWRPIFEAHRRGEDAFLHRHLMDHYKSRLASLGYVESVRDDEVGLEPLMQNVKEVPLYRLLFASKHRLGNDFWRKILAKDPSGQRRLL